MTKKELAAVAGYSYRRLHDIDRDLARDKKLFVEGEGGKYDLALFVQRWVEYNVHQETAGSGAEDLDVVKARHEVIKAEKTQLEVDRMRGQLIDVQDVRRLWGDIANTITQNLIHLPSKVAPLVRMMDNTEVISGIIDAEMRKTLDNIADTPLPAYAADDDANSESEEDGDEEA